MEFIELEIVQWEKHQPRKDIKHPTWFALNNRILEDAKLFDLSDAEWKALLYIFCQASQQNKAKVTISISHARRVCEIQEKTLRSAIAKLAYAGVTSALHARDADVTDAIRDTTLQDTTEQNTTNTTGTVAKVAPGPTEVSKPSDFLEILSTEIKSLYQDDPDYLPRESIKAWAWCVNNPSKKPKSIRGWRTFFGGWLERGWERHRKSLPSNASGSNAGITPEEQAVFDRAQREASA